MSEYEQVTDLSFVFFLIYVQNGKKGSRMVIKTTNV